MTRVLAIQGRHRHHRQMDNNQSNDILSFPCRFPIKIVGREGAGLESLVEDIIDRHIKDLTEIQMRTRTSKNGNYLAVTVTFEAQSRSQLDDIYRDLSAHQAVIMAL